MNIVDSEKLYGDGKEYDFQNADYVADIPFYLRRIEKYGDPVLELACGTGRITLPIAAAGYRITGMDISSAMLAVAKKKAVQKKISVQWIQADIRKFDLNRKFNLIFLPFNSIAHIHARRDIESLLKSVANHLTEKGRFMIDVFIPSMKILTRPENVHFPVAEFPDPGGRGLISITETQEYDPITQINHLLWYKKLGDTVEIVENNMRMFFPRELEALLHYNGFEIELQFGNYDESPMDNNAPKQLLICRKVA